MFATPGLVLLLLVDYLKPQEYVPWLAGLPLLHAFTLLTLVGFAVDLRLGLSRLALAPQLALAGAFALWSTLGNLPQGPAVLLGATIRLLIPLSLFVLVGHVVQTFRALELVLAALLATALALAAVGVHQRFAPWGCHRVQYRGPEKVMVHDGRECAPELPTACRVEGEVGGEYECERVGLFGTSSVGEGRVRFRGTIGDPNELAVAVAVAMPLAFAFFARRRTAPRLALLVAAVALAGLCAVFTQSRGGQLVFVAVLGVYFARRFGLRGLAVGLLCALPVLLLGGRATEEASASTSERLELLYAGVEMFRRSPLVGVGLGQFTEHAPLTAHNSLILTAAELGLPGMLLWSAVVYVSFKIPLAALRCAAPSSPLRLAPVALSWALALLAAMTGLGVGMFFLSFAYKEQLWIFVGLSAALYHAIRRHEPAFRVAFGGRDLALVLGGDLAVIAAAALYTRLQLGA